MNRLRIRLGTVRDSLAPSEWLKVGGMVLTIVLLNVVGWSMLFVALHGHYHVSKTEVFGFGTGVLAYTLGMRHAFDADHIAAIDNTTRKLIGDGKRPLSVGYFFSLGHSTIVFVLAVLLNVGIRALNGAVSNGGSGLHHWTGIIGTTVSGSFLCLIGLLNLVVLVSIIKVGRAMRQGQYDEEELERQLDSRGLVNRFLGGYAKRIDTPWKMYPVGVLFGLGFDTASEVALLVLAGTAVVGGLPFYAVIALPVLFAGGMCLFDTIDGCFMNFAYDWAFAKPVRKIYYNLTITGLSVFVALFVGGVEILGLVAQQANLSGGLWDFMQKFDINRAGYVIVGVFVVTWIVALAVWHFGEIERRWENQMAEAPRTLARADEDDPKSFTLVSTPGSRPGSMPTPSRSSGVLFRTRAPEENTLREASSLGDPSTADAGRRGGGGITGGLTVGCPWKEEVSSGRYFPFRRVASPSRPSARHVQIRTAAPRRTPLPADGTQPASGGDPDEPAAPPVRARDSSGRAQRPEPGSSRHPRGGDQRRGHTSDRALDRLFQSGREPLLGRIPGKVGRPAPDGSL